MEFRLVLPVSVDKDVLSAAEHSYPPPFFFPLLRYYCGVFQTIILIKGD